MEKTAPIIRDGCKLKSALTDIIQILLPLLVREGSGCSGFIGYLESKVPSDLIEPVDLGEITFDFFSVVKDQCIRLIVYLDGKLLFSAIAHAKQVLILLTGNPDKFHGLGI